MNVVVFIEFLKKYNVHDIFLNEDGYLEFYIHEDLIDEFLIDFVKKYYYSLLIVNYINDKRSFLVAVKPRKVD